MSRSVIKDPIWGEIILLPWEKALLNTRAFNRLHNVLQNSNGYRVYPSARHSRFAHSLGTMHVATEITCGLFDNHFSRDKLEILESKRIDLECSKLLLAECNRINNEVQKRLSPQQRDELSVERPNFLISQDLFPVLCVIRVASLLHDIGHLPYSHVFEHALDNWKPTAGSMEKELMSCFEDAQGAAHEQVGKWLMKFLAKHDTHTRKHPLLRILISIAIQVLHGDKDHHKTCFPILKTIVSGVIDADRIDYIRRDGEMSGFMKSGVDYQRLFRNFITRSHTIKDDGESNNHKTEQKTIHFVCPSLKAKSDLEKILWERYQEYLYVVGHHKVILFDEITKRIICHLLESGKISDLTKGLFTLSKVASLQVAELGDHDEDRNAVREFLELHCDDGYIDEKIKEAVIQNDRGDISYKNQHLRKILLTYAEKRDLFKSAFKTDYDFWEMYHRMKGHQLSDDPYEAADGITLEALGVDPDGLGETIEGVAEFIEELVYDKLNKKFHLIIAKSQASYGLGFKTRHEEAFALGGLKTFLLSTRNTMRPFNFWVVEDETDEDEKKEIPFQTIFKAITEEYQLGK